MYTINLIPINDPLNEISMCEFIIATDPGTC